MRYGTADISAPIPLSMDGSGGWVTQDGTGGW